jgi:hypothetical protein
MKGGQWASRIDPHQLKMQRRTAGISMRLAAHGLLGDRPRGCGSRVCEVEAPYFARSTRVECRVRSPIDRATVLFAGGRFWFAKPRGKCGPFRAARFAWDRIGAIPKRRRCGRWPSAVSGLTTHRQFRQFVNETGNVTLRSGQSARGGRRDELRPAPAQHQVSAQGAPKAARTCALRTIAAVVARPHPTRSRSIVLPATSDFAVSSEPGARHVRRRHAREIRLKD